MLFISVSENSKILLLYRKLGRVLKVVDGGGCVKSVYALRNRQIYLADLK